MSKYIKLFETHSQYEAYTADTASFITPNVSFCMDVPNEVHYNPLLPQHPYVEIGGRKWATMNIGASSPTDIGLYFAWGETETKESYTWDNYKFGGNASGGQSKYNSTDRKRTLDLEDDVAHLTLGGNWRIPTQNEFAALLQSATTTWTSNYMDSGVAGLVITDKTDNTKVLFLPAGGFYEYGIHNVGTIGYYWYSSPTVENYPAFAYALNFQNGSVLEPGPKRFEGFPIRPILGE